MVKLTLTLLVLSACGSHQAPSVVTPAHPAPHTNRAVEHAKNNSIDPACIELRTGDPKQADEAFCVSGHVLIYCFAGEGKGGDCAVVADLRPKPPQPPEQAQPAAPAPAPARTDEKTEKSKTKK